ALVVGLPEVELKLVAAGGVTGEPLHVLERRPAVGLRLARAEQIEVGPVENVDGLRHGGAPESGPLYRHLVRKGGAAVSSPCEFARERAQHVSLPQRAVLTFSLSVARPTAPITTSLPIT